MLFNTKTRWITYFSRWITRYIFPLDNTFVARLMCMITHFCVGLIQSKNVLSNGNIFYPTRIRDLFCILVLLCPFLSTFFSYFRYFYTPSCPVPLGYFELRGTKRNVRPPFPPQYSSSNRTRCPCISMITVIKTFACSCHFFYSVIPFTTLVP